MDGNERQKQREKGHHRDRGHHSRSRKHKHKRKHRRHENRSDEQDKEPPLKRHRMSVFQHHSPECDETLQPAEAGEITDQEEYEHADTQQNEPPYQTENMRNEDYDQLLPPQEVMDDAHDYLHRVTNQVFSDAIHKTPDEIAMLLYQADLFSIVKSVLASDTEYLHYLLDLIAKCCQSSRSSLVSDILGCLLSSNFFAHPKLHHVMLQVICGNQGVRHIKHVVSILEIVKQIMIQRPFDLEHIQVILVLLDGIMVRAADLDMQDVAPLHHLHISLSQSETTYKNHMEDLATKAKYKELSERLAQDQAVLQSSDVLDHSERYIPIIKSVYNNRHEYIEVHFKLLHEDFLQPLRSGVQHYKDRNRDSDKTTRFRDYDIKVFEGVKVVSKKYDPTEGVLITVQVNDQNLDRNARKILFGSLMCLVNFDLTSVIFTTVAGTDDTKAGLLHLLLETQDSHAQQLFDRDFIMIESTAYYRAYKFVLNGLRSLHSCHPDHLPRMMKYFASPLEEVPAPLYLSRKPDLEYDFSCLMKSSKREFCSLAVSSTWPSFTQIGLNKSQYDAFKTALTHEISIIQGPPGTGKSYLGSKIVNLLLHNRHAWDGSSNPGPILVICFNNHALDQFLEEILDQHRDMYLFKNLMVRVGNQSESERLKRWNLRALRKSSLETEDFRLARNTVYQLRDILQRLQFDLRETVSGILRFEVLSEDDEIFEERGNRATLERLGLRDENFISEVSRLLHVETPAPVRSDISDNVEDMFEMHNRKLDVDEDFDDTKEELVFGSQQALNFSCHVREESHLAAKYLLQATRDPCSKLEQIPARYAAYVDDWKCYQDLLCKYQAHLQTRINEEEQNFREALDVFREHRAERDCIIMQQSRIIGMTTSGAATCQKELDVVAPKIVVVEEAAEILEAHVVTSISKHCQQLIMIGDHKQLRPKPNAYSLACSPYNLGVSLFERLLEKGLAVDRLTVQHRMRPEIRELLVPEFYESLKDHESVRSMEHIRGMKHDLYFIDHDKIEDEGKTTSPSNAHEAHYLVHLASYLLKQGYTADNITILAPYTGQVRLIRSYINEDCTLRNLKVRTIDNYQGEENDIILLSLVRNNTEKKIGFMKEPTRICVSLSRARKGLYILGNQRMLASLSEEWKTILAKMKKQQLLGKSLWLQCKNHDKPVHTEMRTIEDFSLVSGGGCSRPCGARLDCGHACPRNCHSKETDHEYMSCDKPCGKSCPNGHQCRKKCFERCYCTELMEKLMPSCGHKQKIECAISPEIHECKAECQKKLKCGHMCSNFCGEPCSLVCTRRIEITLSCGHLVTTECCKSSSVVCQVQCTTDLKCGHPCKGTCGMCFQGRLHVSCKRRCDRTLFCGHLCTSYCTSCSPCEQWCRRRCTHSRCQRQCWEVCAPCKEPCDWRCKHFTCTKKCGELCDRPRCDFPCTKKLRCGHSCVGLCNEPCPKLCRICNRDELCEIFFGHEEEENARFIQLYCEHVFEVKGLDHWMDIPDSGNSIQPKRCPKCQVLVNTVLRYGNLIKENHADIDAVKRKISQQQETFESEARSVLNKLQKYDVRRPLIRNLEKGRHDIVHVAKVLLQFHTHLDKTIEMYNKSKLDKKEMRILNTVYNIRLDKIAQRQIISDLEKDEFIAELERFRMLVHFWRMTENPSIIQLEKKQQDMKENCAESEFQPFDVRAETTTIQEMFKSGHVLSASEIKHIKDVLSKSSTVSQVAGLSEDERIMIVSAMDYKRGHWYKCPQGHPYIITECGGAMQKSKCPECGAEIGGTNHRLTDGNAVASEMDGASHAAWSDAANMANYQLDN